VRSSRRSPSGGPRWRWPGRDPGVEITVHSPTSPSATVRGHRGVGPPPSDREAAPGAAPGAPSGSRQQTWGPGWPRLQGRGVSPAGPPMPGRAVAVYETVCRWGARRSGYLNAVLIAETALSTRTCARPRRRRRRSGASAGGWGPALDGGRHRLGDGRERRSEMTQHEQRGAGGSAPCAGPLARRRHGRGDPGGRAGGRGCWDAVVTGGGQTGVRRLGRTCSCGGRHEADTPQHTHPTTPTPHTTKPPPQHPHTTNPQLTRTLKTPHPTHNNPPH